MTRSASGSSNSLLYRFALLWLALLLTVHGNDKNSNSKCNINVNNNIMMRWWWLMIDDCDGDDVKAIIKEKENYCKKKKKKVLGTSTETKRSSFILFFLSITFKATPPSHKTSPNQYQYLGIISPNHPITATQEGKAYSFCQCPLRPPSAFESDSRSARVSGVVPSTSRSHPIREKSCHTHGPCCATNKKGFYRVSPLPPHPTFSSLPPLVLIVFASACPLLVWHAAHATVIGSTLVSSPCPTSPFFSRFSSFYLLLFFFHG